jgi:threonine/homoserine/homoserine lactone efflux protein
MVLLLGFLTGLALVAPVGPVALTLFGLGAEQGRRAALAGAGGVVLADSITMPVALGAAGFLGGLDTGVVRWLEIAMGITLVVIAIATMAHAERARHALGSLRRPVRALAAMTLLNPLSAVAWMGLALALPSSIATPMALAGFGAGILAASAVWHGALAAASGSFAHRLGHRPRTVITRVSGVMMLAIGGVLVV